MPADVRRDPVTTAKRLVRRAGAVVGTLTSIRTSAGCVALTYDDGPEPGGTDAVLEVLAERGVHATFFVLVSRARRYPALLDEVVAAGHEIALHGLDHRRLSTLGYREAHRRTADGRAELEDRTGRPVAWMRPPYGAQSPATWAAVRRAGLVPVLWDSSSFDWQDMAQDERLARAEGAVARGSILLCHDGHADERDGVDDGPAPAVDRADLARRLLDLFAEQGWSAGTLSAAAASGRAVKQASFRR